MNKVAGTLIILTKNEIEGLQKMLPKMPLDQIEEVICVDAQSSDGTRQFLKKYNIRVVIQKKMGRGEAFRIANKIAQYDNIIFFSPDGNEDPNDILKIFALMEQGYEMVIASRFMKSSKADDSDAKIPYRSFGNIAFTKIINLLWGGNLVDSINGFRGIKRDKFKMINPDAEGFGIEFQTSIRALKLGLKIKEIPTIEAKRIGGISTSYTFRTGFYFIGLILRELFNGKRFVEK